MNRSDINYYWIQKTDYSAEEFQVSSKEQAINDFLKYDWQTELKKYNESDDSLNCSTGFGLHDGLKDGTNFTTLLHICPIDKNQVFFNLHYQVENKFLGIFKYKSNEIFYKNEVSYNDVIKIIGLFYDSNVESIIIFFEEGANITSSN